MVAIEYQALSNEYPLSSLHELKTKVVKTKPKHKIINLVIFIYKQLKNISISIDDRNCKNVASSIEKIKKHAIFATYF